MIDGGRVSVIERPTGDVHGNGSQIGDLDPLFGIGTDGIGQNLGDEDGWGGYRG